MNKKKVSLELKTKKRIFSNLLGEHTSIFSGSGLDFKELREYSSGDDIRHINWKVTARNTTPAINVFNEDKQLNIALVYLNSGGIYFGSKQSKQTTMIEILSILGYATISKHDMLSTIFFSDDEQKFFKPTKHFGIIDTIINTANDLEILGKNVDYKKLENYLLEKIKKKSIIFIVGDFLQLVDFKFLSAKHEINCIIVRDKLEEDLKLLGEFDFVNTNNLSIQNIVLNKKTIQQYNQQFKQQDSILINHFKKLNINYQKIYTDDDVLNKLKQMVKKWKN
jgi:uncharacterized protein (DUF58 family)